MALSQVYDRGGSAIQIIPCTVVNGELDDVFGTPISLNVIGDIKPKFSLTGSESSDERTEVPLIHGITLSVPKNTKKIDKSGAEVTSGSGGTGGGDSIAFTCYEQDIAFLKEMQALKGDTFVIWAPAGDRNHDGFFWLLARFDGELEVTRSGNAINGVSLTAVGKALPLQTGVTAASFLSALTSAVSPITQPGLADVSPGTPLNPTTNITTTNGMLVAGDIANPGLLAGTIVMKQGA
jgi:hypothetical protein